MAQLLTPYCCNCCCQIPEAAPTYRCPNRHLYCVECYRKLQRRYKGTIEGAGSCLLCSFSGSFEKSDVKVDFSKKLKTNPGIGKPFRYDTRTTVRSEDKHEDDDMYTSHLELESSQEDRSIPKSMWTMRSVSVSNVGICTSNTSLTCLHYNCNKTVAVAALYSHFRHDHRNVPYYETTRGRELRLLFDVSSVERYKTLCLAMITLYEDDQMDLARSHSALNTSSMYSRRVPINTFWLMMTGPMDNTRFTSCVLFWIYSNSEYPFSCTLDLSSENDDISLSTFSSVVGLHESLAVNDIANKSLIVRRFQFIELLEAGDKINLTITLH